MKPNISTPAGGSLKTGLISCWELDEIDGTTAYDSYGSNHGTILNGTLINQAGKINTSYSFDGVNDYVRTLYTAQLPLQFSLSFWLAHGFAASTGFDRIICKGLSSTSGTQELFIQQNSTANVVYALIRNTSTGAYTAVTPTLTAGVFYFITVTFDGVYIRMYSNGILTGTSTAFSGVRINTTYPLIFGTSSTLQSSTFYKGKLDQVGFWDKVLDVSEMASLYNSGNGLAYINW